MGEELVYLLQGGPYYKIGRTKNLVKRIKVIQTSHPYPLVVVHTWQVVNGAVVESYLHRKFASVKMKGEWFQLIPSEIEALSEVKEWHIETPHKERLEHVSRLPARPGSLRALIESRTGIRTPGALRKDIPDMSRQQAWLLWHGRTTLGLRTAKRIAEATGIPLEDLAEVDEAVPGKPMERHRHKPPEHDVE